MPLPNIFTKEVSGSVIARINKLSAESQRQWGKMTVSQMLAHCSVAYETIYEPNKHPPPNFIMKFILKNFVKGLVVGEKPFKRNSRTAPIFIIDDERDFEREKSRLIAFIEKTQQLGEEEFDGRESPSFGAMTKTEWSNMMYKHLNHHLEQFGV